MSKPSPQDSCACCTADLPTDSGRREMLTGVLSLAALAATSLPAMAQDAAPGRSTKPQPGDKLAFMLGPKEGKEILPADIKFGEPPTLAYPMDPTTGKALVAKAYYAKRDKSPFVSGVP